jgi:putative ABC transport system permease protein
VALQFRTNLPDLLEASEARGASSRAILATILAGPAGLAVAVEILVARLAASRLRASLALLRARGASAAQRRLLLGVPALAVGLVAAALGLAIALLLPGGGLGVAGVVAVTATALAPAVLVVLFGAPPERRAAGEVGIGRLRLVGEAVVLLAAVASVGSVVQRGDDAAPAGGIDPVAAAVPLTLSLLGCIITLRLYPVVLRRAAPAAHRSRGIAPFLGLARSLRAGSAGLVPVLAVLIGVSVAVFSGVLSATLAAGTDTAAQERVGADLAVDGVRLDPDGVQAIRDVDGVDLATGVSRDLFHDITPDDVSRFPATLVLVDPAEFAAVQRGVPGALDIPAAVAGESDEPIPLAVSAGVAALTGGEADATIDRYTDVELTGPPLDSEIFNTSGNWVLADVANAETLDYPSPVVANQVLVRLDDGASAAAVTAAVRSIVGDDAAITTPAVVAAERAANPAVGGIRSAALLAIFGAVTLSAAALALTTVLDGRSRRTALALLATLGLDRRQSRRTVAWELAPLSVVGLVVGLVLGAALSAVVLTTVDLRPFTAGIAQPPPVVDPVLTAAVVGGFVLMLVGAGVVAAWNAVPRSTSVAVDGREPT